MFVSERILSCSFFVNWVALRFLPSVCVVDLGNVGDDGFDNALAAGFIILGATLIPTWAAFAAIDPTPSVPMNIAASPTMFPAIRAWPSLVCKSSPMILGDSHSGVGFP